MPLSNRALVLIVVGLGMAGCGASLVVALAGFLFGRSPALQRSGPPRYAYWNEACVSADGKLLAAGGAGFAVLDVAAGRVLASGHEDVYGVGCSTSGAVVLGYTNVWTWPGGIKTPPVVSSDSRFSALYDDGTRARTLRPRSLRRSRGALEVTLDQAGSSRELGLKPEQFGAVGRHKPEILSDSFRIVPGGALPGRRLLLAAGWQPNHAGSHVEPDPWGFFALRVDDGRIETLRAPLASDAGLNFLRSCAAAADAPGRTLALATSNGTTAEVAVFRDGAAQPLRARLGGWDEVSRVALSPDGTLVAAASVGHGASQPAELVVLDTRSGRRVFGRASESAIYGLALLADRSLVWANSGRLAERVALSEGRVLWRSTPP